MPVSSVYPRQSVHECTLNDPLPLTHAMQSSDHSQCDSISGGAAHVGAAVHILRENHALGHAQCANDLTVAADALPTAPQGIALDHSPDPAAPLPQRLAM